MSSKKKIIIIKFLEDTKEQLQIRHKANIWASNNLNSLREETAIWQQIIYYPKYKSPKISLDLNSVLWKYTMKMCEIYYPINKKVCQLLRTRLKAYKCKDYKIWWFPIIDK